MNTLSTVARCFLFWVMTIALVLPLVFVLPLIAIIVVCTLGLGLIVVVPMALVVLLVLKTLIRSLWNVIVVHPSWIFIRTMLGVGVAIVIIPSIPGGLTPTVWPLPYLANAIAAVFAWFIATNSTPGSSSPNDVLQTYIHQASSAGMQKSDIIAALKNNGWNDGDIDAAFQNI